MDKLIFLYPFDFVIFPYKGKEVLTDYGNKITSAEVLIESSPLEMGDADRERGTETSYSTLWVLLLSLTIDLFLRIGQFVDFEPIFILKI